MNRLSWNLYVMIVAVLGAGPARVWADGEWVRRDVRTLGFAVDLPVGWGYEIQGSRLVSRELPVGHGTAVVSVYVARADASLDETARMHQESSLPGSYPGCKIKQHESRQIGDLHAHFFHVARLGKAQLGSELFDMILRVEGRHIFLSLFFPSGRARDYRDFYQHIVESVEVRAGAPLPGRVSNPGESRARRRPPKGTVFWRSNFDAAFAEAKERGVPVLIALNMDNERANNRILKSHYQAEDVLELSQKMVCLIGSVFDHGAYDRGGSNPVYCRRFGSLFCLEHRRVEIAVRETYLRTPTAIAPQHMVCSPDGQLISRREYMLPRGDLVRMMEGAIAAVERKARLGNVKSSEDFVLLFEKASSPTVRRETIGDVLYFGDVEIARGFFRLLSRKKEVDLVEVLSFVRDAGHTDGALCAGELLDHTEDSVRMAAALAVLAAADSRVLGLVKMRIKQERSPRIKNVLLRALGAASEEDPKIADLLVRYSKSGTVAQKCSAMIALRHFPESKKVHAAVLRAFRSGRDEKVKTVAVLVLGALGASGAAPLIERWALDRPDSIEVDVAAWALECLRGDRDSSSGFEDLRLRLVP